MSSPTNANANADSNLESPFDYDAWAKETGLNEWAEEDLRIDRLTPRYRICYKDPSMPLWTGQCPRCWQQMNLLEPDEEWIRGGEWNLPSPGDRWLGRGRGG